MRTFVSQFLHSEVKNLSLTIVCVQLVPFFYLQIDLMQNNPSLAVVNVNFRTTTKKLNCELSSGFHLGLDQLAYFQPGKCHLVAYNHLGRSVYGCYWGSLVHVITELQRI